MTDAPSPRCSSGSRGPFAWRCNDEYYPHIFGLVTDRQVTVDAWRAGGIKFEALYSADSASSPTPQIAGGVRERAESSIECLRAPDPALKAVPNTVRQALAEVIEQLLAALSPQAQAGETCSYPSCECKSSRCQFYADTAVKSAPDFLPPHSSDERLPSGDAADSGAGTFGVAQGSIDRDKLWHMIAKHIACEEDCQKWPNGCGCAMAAADAILASPPAALPAGDLQEAFKAVDDKDWAHLDQFIPQSGHGRFWRALFADIRRTLALPSTDRAAPEEPRDALGQTASEVYSSDFAPPTLREALKDLLKDIDESQALGMPVLLRRDTIAEARAALALSSTEHS